MREGISIAITLWQFYKSDERAGDLLIPYILWVTFALKSVIA